MSQNWHCNQSLLGHPVLWTQEEAITAITSTTDPSLEREAFWHLTKHNVTLGDNIRILMAQSVTSTMPRCSTCFRAGLANKLVGGPATLNHSGRNFQKLCSRDSSDAHCCCPVDSWMPIRESLAPAMRCATLEVARLHLIAIIVDLSPKVDQVNQNEDDSEDGSDALHRLPFGSGHRDRRRVQPGTS